MSVQKHFEKAGVQIADDNSLPRGQRTQKTVKRVIAAVRAAEAEFNDELRDANERCRKAQEQVISLQDHVRSLEADLLRQKLEHKLGSEEFERLSTAERTELLECAQSEGSR